MNEINQPSTMTEQEAIDILRLADRTVKNLEREIRDLPKPLVWKCNSREEIGGLKKHFQEAIEDWRKRLPGSNAFERTHFLSLIEAGERELKEINDVLEAIGDMA